ncbi:hypothetical protein MCOR02_012423 [Pyricularia oryzae]|nr:hypothetical protein MCOR02_012423 [Pyricularia oryzae]
MHLETDNPVNLSPGGQHRRRVGAHGHARHLGFGGDIGGSIRVPAAHVGLYGFKATWKRLSARGLLAPAAGKETMGASPGPLAADRDALDLFMRVALAAKPWRIDPSVVEMPWRPYDEFAKGKRRLKVAVQWWDGVVQPHPPMTRALREVAGACRRAGIEVVDWTLCLERDNLQIHVRPGVVGHGQGRGRRGGRHPLPANFGAATPHDQSKYWGYTSHWNLVDYPAVVFPVTTVDPVKDVKDASYTPKNAQDRFVYDMYTPDKFANAPVSLQIVGRRFHDEKVLAALVEIERAIGRS